MAAERAHYPVARMADLLEVSRSGYYKWASAEPSQRQLRQRDLSVKVAQSHRQSDGIYGAPRVLADLRESGEVVSRKTVARLMRAQGLQGISPRSWKTTTVHSPFDTYPPDLVNRRWDRGRVDKVWVGDITCMRLSAAHNWVYLATVIDGHSRRLLGWALAEHMRADLVQQAMAMAVTQRTSTRNRRRVIFHTDRGTQYASAQIADYATKNRIRRSMGRTGVCWDNALAESFFSTYKTEFFQRHEFTSNSQLISSTSWWIENVYNRTRRHSALGQQAPVAYEQLTQATMAA